MRAAISVLASYPSEIVQTITDPRRGLPSKSQFLPTIYEIRAACDAAMRPLLETERIRRLQAENKADQRVAPKPEDNERRKAVAAAYKARVRLREGVASGVETPLETMDTRQLRGAQRELVAKALDAKLQRLAEASKAAPLRFGPLLAANYGARAMSPPQDETLPPASAGGPA